MFAGEQQHAELAVTRAEATACAFHSARRSGEVLSAIRRAQTQNRMPDSHALLVVESARGAKLLIVAVVFGCAAVCVAGVGLAFGGGWHLPESHNSATDGSSTASA